VRSAREAKGVWGGHSCPPPLILLFELDLGLNRVPHPSRVLCDRVGIFLLPGINTHILDFTGGCPIFSRSLREVGISLIQNQSRVPHVCVLCKRGILHSLAAYTFPLVSSRAPDEPRSRGEYNSRDLHCVTFSVCRRFKRGNHFTAVTTRWSDGRPRPSRQALCPEIRIT
jgi:hypothetical protein